MPVCCFLGLKKALAMLAVSLVRRQGYRRAPKASSQYRQIAIQRRACLDSNDVVIPTTQTTTIRMMDSRSRGPRISRIKTGDPVLPAHFTKDTRKSTAFQKKQDLNIVHVWAPAVLNCGALSKSYNAHTFSI